MGGKKVAHAPVKARLDFRYLHLGHPKFQLQNCSEVYLQELVKAVESIVNLQWVEFDQAGENFFLHPNTKMAEDFSCLKLEPEDAESLLNSGEDESFLECYTFRITDRGRCHGFIQIPTFYVVWLDGCHEGNPMPKAAAFGEAAIDRRASPSWGQPS